MATSDERLQQRLDELEADAKRQFQEEQRSHGRRITELEKIIVPRSAFFEELEKRDKKIEVIGAKVAALTTGIFVVIEIGKHFLKL